MAVRRSLPLQSRLNSRALASLRLAEKIGLRVVRETLEPKFGRLLEVFVVEREIFEEATGSQTAVEDGLHSAKVLDTTTRAH